MFKVLKIAMIGGILVAGANAEDFLAKVTAGALSDISSNVKKLDVTDMNEVKGGLELVSPEKFSYNESGAYAKYEPDKDSKYIKMQIEQGLGAYNLPGYHLAYTVKREIKSGRYGRYPLFTYSAAAYNEKTKEYHKISSSFVLNNNTVVRQLRDAFKSRMESDLGGW
ncbi:hypothetical protein B9N64_08970 [Campylobacter concisus]|uniref:hypothetical protein n=1 Tax=Campylobacter concisus TaxID=199 RepID=UPI000B3D5580|nr:hypothetical protein [Campylobacter concisus]OUT12604.1 hypothetical protein B9N64_08970 [Campylobacter concisus]